MQAHAGIFAVATSMAQLPDRCRNFPIDTTSREPEHPALHPGSGVYFLLASPKSMSNHLHPEVEELAGCIESAAILLRSYNELHWGSWLAKDVALIRANDFWGVEHFLSAFGGMGSINDLIISPINGHQVDFDQVERANEELRSILSKAYNLASKLQKEELASRHVG